MSLASWKREFYPVPAKRVSERHALAHSLRKWHGLKKENLKRHGVKRDGELLRIVDAKRHRLFIDSKSCALCQHYVEKYCVGCPITTGPRTHCQKAFEAWTDHNNPGPMIRRLEGAMKK